MFMGFLLVCSTALSELGPVDDNVVKAFKQLKQDYFLKFVNQFQGAKDV